MKLSHLKLAASALLISFSLNAPAEVNLRFSPVSLLVGAVVTEVDFKISDQWSLGPSLAYTSADSDGFETQAYAVGIRGNYFFKGTFQQGWYLSPGLQYVSATVKDDSSSGGEIEGKASGFAVNLYGGYLWMWENFNMQLGAGPIVYTLGEIVVEDKSANYKEEFGGYNGIDLGIDFTLGWKF